MTAGYDYDALNAMTAIKENGATSGPGLLATFGGQSYHRDRYARMQGF